LTKKITTLSDREQARQKLPVYFGSNDNFYHPIRESVVNARDILKNVENGKIEVILHSDKKTVTIKDNGAGLPMNGQTDGVDNYILLFLTLFSGTKMEDGEDDAGTNGCGNTVICYTSDYMEAIVHREGKIYNIAFQNGGEILKPFTCLGNTTEQGTEITYRLSDAVYTQTEFDPKEVEFIVEKISATSPNINCVFKYVDYIKGYNYNSFETYFNTHINEPYVDNIVLDKKTYSNQYIDKDKNEEKTEFTTIELIINCCEQNIQYSFLNGIYLPKQGTIHEGVIEGLRNSLNSYIKESGLYENKEKQITRLDIEESISYSCSVSSTKVSFSNQTKFSTEKELYKSTTKEYIQEFFKHYSIEYKDNLSKLAEKILINKRSREKAEELRANTKKKLQAKANGLSPKIEGLKDCDMRNSTMEEREFRVTEGVSPSSTVIDARDPRIMGVYGLRGKFISSLKKSIKEVLSNEPALGIINGLGCGIKMTKEEQKIYRNIAPFDINNLRYGKVFIDTDMDEWGYGIALSLIMFFYVYMPDLLEQGRIYLSVSPRYEIETTKKDKNGEFITLFAYDELGKEEIIKKLDSEGIKYIINIVKGLGQLDKDVFWKYVLDKNNRICKQIICKDVNDGKLEILFNTLMGKDIVNRKIYVKENITNLKIEELD
jgi:DNA gyrase subunit B